MVQLTVSTALKPSLQNTMNDFEKQVVQESEKNITEQSSGKWDVVIPNPKARKRPRLCFFVTSLILLMVAAVALILVIKMSLSLRKDSCCSSSNKTISNENTENTSLQEEPILTLDISWEMKRAFLEMRQIMGDFKPMALFPVYRKDLPDDFIAYYEVKLKHKDGQSYAVISAGEETGDYSLVETGGIPSPLDKLRAQAYFKGHYCSKFFRLTTDGVTICEDHRLNRVVATTGDIYPKSPITHWQQLDDQVSRALPQLKQDWKRMAEVANKIKEWKISGKSTIVDHTNSREHDITERGLCPGEFTEIPVENVTGLRLKFVGLSRHQTTENTANISLSDWQKRLCQILNNICDSKKPTNIRQNAPTLTFAGSKYLRLGVNADEKFVKTTLTNEEVRFQVELSMEDGKKIVMHYGIVLVGKRLGRSVELLNYQIPHEDLFPSIHYDGNCISASTMLSAWSMVFSYYDNLARTKFKYGYRKLGFNKNRLGKRLTSLEDKEQHIVNVLTSKIDMKCSLFVRETKHWDKTKLERWLQQKNGPNSKIVSVAGLHRRQKATRKAIHLVKKGYPVVISVEHEYTSSPRYGVVTRMRQQRSSYRRCSHMTCSFWENVALTEFYVRDGKSNGKWQSACTYNIAAAIIQ